MSALPHRSSGKGPIPTGSVGIDRPDPAGSADPAVPAAERADAAAAAITRRQARDRALHDAARGRAPIPAGFERIRVTAEQLRAGDWLVPTGGRVTSPVSAGVRTPTGKVDVWVNRYTAKRGWFIRHGQWNRRTRMFVLRRSA